GHHALALAEEIWEDAGVADGDGLHLIGDGELHLHASAALEATLGHEAAQANAPARWNGLLRHLPGREKADDRVAQGDGHQQHGKREHADAKDDKDGTALLAGHGSGPRAGLSPTPTLVPPRTASRADAHPVRDGPADKGVEHRRRRWLREIMNQGPGSWRA